MDQLSVGYKSNRYSHRKIARKCIRETFLEQRSLHSNQDACISEKSWDYIQDFVLMAYLDIDGTFDNTSFEFIKASSNCGVKNAIYKWMTVMLEGKLIGTSSLSETM